MSANMPKNAASVMLSTVIHSTVGFCAPAAGNVSTGGRSFRQFLFSPLNWLRRSKVGTAKPLAVRRCVLCASSHLQPARLARIVAALPIGSKTTIPKISLAVGERFKVVNQDLIYLEKFLGLPIRNDKKHSFVLLDRKIAICQDCTKTGAAIRRPQNISAADDGGNHLMRDRCGEQLKHNQAVRRPDAVAPPFQS